MAGAAPEATEPKPLTSPLTEERQDRHSPCKRRRKNSTTDAARGADGRGRQAQADHGEGPGKEHCRAEPTEAPLRRAGRGRKGISAGAHTDAHKPTQPNRRKYREEQTVRKSATPEAIQYPCRPTAAKRRPQQRALGSKRPRLASPVFTDGTTANAATATMPPAQQPMETAASGAPAEQR